MHAFPRRVAAACLRRTRLARGVATTSAPIDFLGLCSARFMSSSVGTSEPSKTEGVSNKSKNENTSTTHAEAAASSTRNEAVSAEENKKEKPADASSSTSPPVKDSSEASPTKTENSNNSSNNNGGQSNDNNNSNTPATTSNDSDKKKGEITTPEPEPVRWVQPAYQDPDSLPIVDEKGEYIVSRVQWPTGEVAYRTPAPVDDKLAPRFGYNIVQVRKHVSWWKYNQKYPRLSLAYINIQVLFLLGLAWLVAFLTTEYRHTTEAMRTPGAMVGQYRGKGPATNQTQKITFEKDEMMALMDKAQNNWYDGKAEASYIGSKEYKMKKIPRPKEFSAEDFRKR